MLFFISRVNRLRLTSHVLKERICMYV